MLSAIDHIGVAVEDIDAAVALYRDGSGCRSCTARRVAEQGVEAALLDVGDGHVELLAPLGPETAVGKFLARAGPGLHHVAYRVEDIEQTLASSPRAGRAADRRAARGPGIRGSRVAFLHPALDRRRTHRDRAAGSGGPLMAKNDEKPQKISIGFHRRPGAERPGSRRTSSASSARRSACRGWHELPLEDGTVALDLARIDYVLVDHDEHRVGF